MKKVTNVREGNARHLKYFNATDKVRLAGKIMMIASGALFVWTWYFWWSYALYLLMIGMFPVGLVLFVLGSRGKSTDEEIDGVVSKLSSEADIDVEKDADVVRRQLRTPTPEVVSGYDYSDGLMFKKAKSGVIRSEIFKKATLVPLNEGLYISMATVNIPLESVKKEYFEIPYGEIDEIRVVSERKTVRFLKNSFSVNDSRLEIISKGSTFLSIPGKESATLDAFIEELKARKI